MNGKVQHTKHDGNKLGRLRTTYVRVLLLGAIVAATVSVAACGGDDGADEQVAVDATDASIEIIQPGPHPYIEAQNEGFEKAAAELGANIRINDANWDATQADAAIRNALSRGSDAIIVHAVEAEASVPGVERANAEGVCTVGLTSNVGPDQESVYEGMKGFVGWKDSVGGELAARALAEAMGGEGDVIVMQGVLASTSEQARVDGAIGVWETEYPDINVLTTVENNFDVEEARSLMQDLVQRYGDDIDGAYITTNFEAVAAADVLAESGRVGEVPIVSNGAWGQFLEYIEQGKTTAVVPFAPQDEARRALELALDCIGGDEEPVYVEETELPALQALEEDGFVITEENLDKFDPQW